MMIALEIFFVASVAVLSFGYGFVAARYHFFPYAILDRGIQGLKAQLALEDDALMAGLIAPNPQAPTVPRITRLLPDAGTERLLVVGGPYQMMDRCPRFGCLAWVMTRDGTILHSWEVDPDELWAGISGFYGRIRQQNFYPIGAALGPDGHLVLTFHARLTSFLMQLASPSFPPMDTYSGNGSTMRITGLTSMEMGEFSLPRWNSEKIMTLPATLR